MPRRNTKRKAPAPAPPPASSSSSSHEVDEKNIKSSRSSSIDPDEKYQNGEQFNFPKVEDDEDLPGEELNGGGGFLVVDKKKKPQSANRGKKRKAGESEPTSVRPTRSSRAKANVSYVISDDDQDALSADEYAPEVIDLDDDDDEEDQDFLSALDPADDDDDDDVIITFHSNGAVSGSSHDSIALDDSDHLSDTPIANLETPAKRAKRAPKAKKPKASSSNDNGNDDEEVGADSTPAAGEEGSEAKPKRKRAPRKKKEKEDKPKLTPFERRTNKLFTHHPSIVGTFEHLADTQAREVVRASQPADMTLRLLPFQLEGLTWLLAQEQSIYNGGILADEMGMGKTIQMIALMMNDRKRVPNLVVAPTVALMQWKHEIEEHAGGLLKVAIYHGPNRAKKISDFEGIDVIMTSYAILESAYRKQKYGFNRGGKKVREKSLLHSMKFYRVVLDEAHNIKDRQSGTAKAASELNTEKRWCLSGTPLQNRIGELYSLLRFLEVEPFCNYYCTSCPCSSREWYFPDWRTCGYCGHSPMVHSNFFNHFMLKNIQKFGFQGEGFKSFEKIQHLLKHIMLRRTKIERADDLGLPPKIEEVRRHFFNEEEKDLYKSLYSNVKRQFDGYVAEGVVLNNYANIFTLLTRMRQMADHPDLVLKRLKTPGARDLKDQIVLKDTIVCQLCDDEAEEPIKSKCNHTFCRMCVSEYIESFNGEESKLECPVCHIGLSIDLEAPALEVDPVLMEKGSIVNRIDMSQDWRSSTKIEALMEELYKSRNDKYTVKSIVFSQFTSMLDLVEWRLKRAGFETAKLQGSMTPEQRDNIIRHFMNTPSVEVFLVSLKAGGVALNLCEASQVFILDPWWNGALEWQAADRISRIGQKRPIRIVRFCIEDSIESRIIELQEKKANMIHATINKDDSAASRLTTADMQFLFNN